MKKEVKLLEEYAESPTRSLFLGVTNKRLDQYKKESNEIKTCACGKPIRLSKHYGEVGYITRHTPPRANKQGEKLPYGWWYDFVKLCPGCSSEITTLLIRKAMKGQIKKGG